MDSHGRKLCGRWTCGNAARRSAPPRCDPLPSLGLPVWLSLAGATTALSLAPGSLMTPCPSLLQRSALLGLLMVLAGCGSDPVGPLAGPPTILSFATAPTEVVVGEHVAPAPRVRLTDAAGVPVAGAVVRFDVVSGGGAVIGDSAVTGHDGTAGPTAWTLGPTPGRQVLRAQVPGQPLSSQLEVFATPGAPVSLQLLTDGTPLHALVGRPVPIALQVRARDGFNNPTPDEVITWRIGSGGGHLEGSPTSRTDAAGIAAVNGWVLGPTPGPNTLIYRASSGVEGVITATAVALPTQFAAVSPLVQSGISSFPVARVPQVIVRNDAGEPVGGVPVLFSLAGAGAISGASTVTGPNGVAALSDWRLGPDGQATVSATVPGTSLAPIEFRATGTAAAFTIDLRFTTAMPAAMRDDYVAAATRWMEIIRNDLSDHTVHLSAFQLSTCPATPPDMDEVVDDMVIFAAAIPIDGPEGVLGRSSNCVVRGGFGHPAIGGVEFDIEDAELLVADHQFTDVALHEMGHVLGLNAGDWGDHGLITDGSTLDPIYTGTAGRAGFAALGLSYSGTPVPLENIGDQGTALHHWRESVLTSELMTGFIEPVGDPMPLTVLTIGALADLGYTVDMSRADPFVPALRAPVEARRRSRPLGEQVFGPRWRLQPDGTVTPIP